MLTSIATFILFHGGLYKYNCSFAPDNNYNCCPRRDVQPIVLGQWPLFWTQRNWWIDGVRLTGPLVPQSWKILSFFRYPYRWPTSLYISSILLGDLGKPLVPQPWKILSFFRCLLRWPICLYNHCPIGYFPLGGWCHHIGVPEIPK